MPRKSAEPTSDCTNAVFNAIACVDRSPSGIVTVPITVVEKTPSMAALPRSWKLTDDYKASIFGVLIVIAFINFGFGAILGAIFGLTVGFTDGDGTSALLSLFVLLMSLLAATWQAIASGVAYHDLRLHREGLDEDELVAVFA